MAHDLTLIKAKPGDYLATITRADFVSPPSFLNQRPGDRPKDRRESFRVIRTEDER